MLLQSTPSKNNSQQVTINKLLQKDLKEIIKNLQTNELITLFRNLEIDSNVTSSKQFSKIGFKCSQCRIKFQDFQSNGYGRDQQQALLNAIRAILQSMIGSSYRIQNIKKALKYCSKYKQPLITSSQKPSNSVVSSVKKSKKKVEGIQQIKMSMNKIHLDYQSQTENSNNKQNVSRAINETLDLDEQRIDDKITIDSKQITIGNQEKKLIKNSFEGKEKDTKPLMTKFTISTSVNSDQQLTTKQLSQNLIQPLKCSKTSTNQCIYYQLQKHSQCEIKSLLARIRLLQQQNSILKEILLKDFNKQNTYKTLHSISQQHMQFDN